MLFLEARDRDLANRGGGDLIVVFDTDHSLSGFRKEIVKVNLEWFDLHLGTVKPGGEKEEP